MSLKTYEDCAKCSHLTLCTAHITGGSHPHNQGVDPCVIVREPNENNKRCRIIESIPDKKGFIIIGIKPDPKGPYRNRKEALNAIRNEHEKSTKTAIPPNPPSTMPRKGEEPEPGYAQRFSLRDGK